MEQDDDDMVIVKAIMVIMIMIKFCLESQTSGVTDVNCHNHRAISVTFAISVTCVISVTVLHVL